MFILTSIVLLTIPIIVNCTSKSTVKTSKNNNQKQTVKNITVSKPKKNASKKKSSAKKGKSKQKSKQRSRLSTLLVQEKTATAKSPTEDERAPPTPSKQSPETGKQMKKETKKKLPDRHPTSIVSPILSEALADEKKKPTFRPATPHRGSEYADEENIEARKTARTQSIETVQESRAEPTKSTPAANESSARRHRNALKPGEVNEKSDDTIEDAPSVKKREGPSYESVDGTPLNSPTVEVLAVKKLSKEKGEETAK